MQPLHIFERRYVELFREALEDDRLIAMALLNPGWEDDYEGRPPIAPVACLGRVVTWQAQPNDRYNLLLLGVGRIQVLREFPADKPFRTAEVEVLEDDYQLATAEARPALHRKLISAFEKMLPHINDAEEMFNQLSVNSISLGTLTDVISYALDLDIRLKQALLAEPNVDCRAKLLLKYLRKAAQESRVCSLAAGFPPAFSPN
jgi:Lon protease-like protein